VTNLFFVLNTPWIIIKAEKIVNKVCEIWMEIVWDSLEFMLVRLKLDNIK
jgi:hypothetical protein